MSANDSGTAEALCAKWMPRKKTKCARTPGHGGPCMTAENMARGECIRGLLCHACNIALGHIERRYAMARAYLDSPPVRLLAAA
jgi:hypothetical protein